MILHVLLVAGFAMRLLSGQTAEVEQARRLAAEGRWSAAEQAYRSLQQRGVFPVEDLESAAEASRRLGHWDRVAELYRSFPLDADRRLRLYEAYLRAGQTAAAEDELRKAMLQRPDDEGLVHLMAFLHLSAGRPHEAASLYTGFIRRHPSAFESRINLALVHFSLQQTGEAFVQLKAAYTGNGEAANRYFYRQLVRNMQETTPGELAELADDVRNELGLPLDGPTAFKYLGEEYEAVNRYAGAVESYRVYLRHRTDDDRVRLSLSKLLLQAGESGEALSVLEPLLGRGDETGRLANLFAAELAVKSGRFQEAEKRLDRLSDDEARLPSCKFLRARIALDRGQAAAALGLLEEVVAEAPEIAEAFLHLGRLYIRLGRREEGRRMLSEFQRRKEEK